VKLQYQHHGRQFFFITLTLEGRVRALSQVVEGQARPLLMPAGEVVRAGLRSMHQVFPAVTISDSVIMPDHLHFLMIVNYQVSPSFNPLWASHMLMNAVETAWWEGAEWTGAAAPEPPLVGKGVTAAMPQMVGGDKLLAAPTFAAKCFSKMVPWLAATVEKGRIEAAWVNHLMNDRGLGRQEALAQLAQSRDIAGLAGARGRKPPSVQNRQLRFNRQCYIELSFDARQLKTIRHYIRLNPARLLWKLNHPDRFVCYPNIRHTVLDASRLWQGMGNLTLLGSPFLFHVRLTLKKSVVDHEAAIAEIVEKAQRGWIPVSGFISPGEVEALRRLKATPGARFIKMLPCSLPMRYDPSTEDSRELAADRLLILSGFTDTPHISGMDIRRAIGASRQFRANCLAMNDLADDLCRRAQG